MVVQQWLSKLRLNSVFVSSVNNCFFLISHQHKNHFSKDVFQVLSLWPRVYLKPHLATGCQFVNSLNSLAPKLFSTSIYIVDHKAIFSDRASRGKCASIIQNKPKSWLTTDRRFTSQTPKVKPFRLFLAFIASSSLNSSTVIRTHDCSLIAGIFIGNKWLERWLMNNWRQTDGYPNQLGWQTSSSCRLAPKSLLSDGNRYSDQLLSLSPTFN